METAKGFLLGRLEGGATGGAVWREATTSPSNRKLRSSENRATIGRAGQRRLACRSGNWSALLRMSGH